MESALSVGWYKNRYFQSPCTREEKYTTAPTRIYLDYLTL